ncbi:MAG: helix-turn-helix domain-containing protein [Anaerolineales bacterium]|nr:helix-turn-helix domain-containing protein [Anaerolineales bacterium]
MKVREVADFLRLTETTVYNLLQKGTLPGKKIGGQWRISQTALTHWLDNAHAEGPTPPPSDPHASAGAG